MFNKVVLPKMKFTIPQLINTEIAKNTKDVTRTAVAIPNQVGKRKPLSTRKLLNGKIDINVSPQKDEVILSTASKPKETPNKTNNHSNGKSIKNVLVKFFDNSKQAEQLEKRKALKEFKNAKKANLESLINEYENEHNYFAQRHESMNLMMQDAITKLAEY